MREEEVFIISSLRFIGSSPAPGRDSNPWPLYHDACAQPLCYNPALQLFYVKCCDISKIKGSWNSDSPKTYFDLFHRIRWIGTCTNYSPNPIHRILIHRHWLNSYFRAQIFDEPPELCISSDSPNSMNQFRWIRTNFQWIGISVKLGCIKRKHNFRWRYLSRMKVVSFLAWKLFL